MDFQSESDLARVKSACAALGEHFDTVQVFVTRHEAGQHDGTVNVQYGLGNWFARHAQVAVWLLRNEEEEREAVRRAG